MTSYQLINGNSLEVLKTLPDNSVDAIVTDPPYGLSQHSQGDIVNALTAWLAGEEYTHGKGGFMGKEWDSFVPSPMLFKECLRVLKPGGHMLCFAGARTQDLMGIAIRLAGFELRDSCLFLYGSGFPKGQNIAKGIEKHFGKEPIIVGEREDFARRRAKNNFKQFYAINPSEKAINSQAFQEKIGAIYEYSTPEAKQWEGWNTNLKPAYEPILMARKPFAGTVVENVLKHGVGGLNIDGCRVESADVVGGRGCKKNTEGAICFSEYKGEGYEPRRHTQGRYPANVILDGSEEVEALFPNDTQRFFYCAKASKRDKDEGLEGMNPHPTVKNTALMRHLVRLVTPKGGVVLDPFMGSGSTGKACMYEGMQFIGVELNPDYVEIAKARIEFAKGDTDATE